MTKISEEIQNKAQASLEGVFISVPIVVRAFKWDIRMKTQDFPAWFRKMIAENKASYTIGSTSMTIAPDGEDVFIGTKSVDSSKKNVLNLNNKRGDYWGLPGDWVVSDEYNHVFIVSQKTFPERYKSLGT